MSEISSHNERDVAPPESVAGKKVLVMGLGRFGGGVGVARWLVEQGAAVTVTDASSAEELAESIHQLNGLPITFKLGGHRLEDFLAADLLIINPAVDKEKSDVVRAALSNGIPHTTEMNLFVQRCPALTIGITGSVGKSTTVSLMDEALRAGLANSDTRVFLGGNIGRSLLPDLPRMRPRDIVLLELSSFMLEDTPAVRWSPNIAVVTNVFANHLDRHNTMACYAAAKKNIMKFQGQRDTAIFNNDHDAVRSWMPLARGRSMTFTAHPPGRFNLLIPGEHNQSNAAAAMAVIDALAIPVDRAAALQAISRFPGLAHRLAMVHETALAHPPGRTLRFYNDSKATSPDASITALRAFNPGTAIFLVGGYDKHIDLSVFATALAQAAAGVIGIGQTGEALCALVREQASHVGREGMDTIQYVGTLEAALPLARQWAAELPSVVAVVLSPASASWGQFANYEKRGERFATLSRSL